MWIIKFAWKNLWRNRSRTLITLAAIFFAVLLSITAESLKKGVFENLVRNVVTFYTGYIQVHKKGYQDEKILDNSFTDSSSIYREINSSENIIAVAPRLESFVLASSSSRTNGCMVIGIDPVAEDKLTSLKSKLTFGRYLDKSDRGVLLARGLAERMQVTTGDTIVLIGQGYHGSTAVGKYPITGILQFGAPQLNDRMLYMPLSLAQELFNADKMITAYILNIANDARLNSTAVSLRERIGSRYEVMTWEELLPEIKQHIATDSNNMKVVQAVLYLLIAFGIFSTLLMMTLERKFEMGMLVAIGMRKSRLMALLVMESVLTVLTGCLMGVAAGALLVAYLNRHPIRIGGDTARAYERFGFEAVFPASNDASIFIDQSVIVVVIGMMLSLYPVLKIIRLKPLTAMKK